MQDDGGRRIQSGVLVIFGALLVLLGLLTAFDAAGTTAEVGRVEGALGCTTDFAKGCTTGRVAVVDHRVHLRRPRLSGEQWWRLWVPDGGPGVQRNGLLYVAVPRQDRREELVEGLQVTVLYFGKLPTWIRLPSEVELVTEHHPRRNVALLAWSALGILGGGAFLVRTGIRVGRRGGG